MPIPTNSAETRPDPPTLVLGTVQLGLPYGAANVTGMPSESEAVALVRSAVAAGVREIDTARAYGDSERRIGLALDAPALPSVKVVTKLAPLDDIPDDAPSHVAVAAARTSLAMSRDMLRRQQLDTLLLHRPRHRTAWSGAIWDLLRAEAAAGHIGSLGVSVQTPSELLSALVDIDVRHVQLPFNLLDRRWLSANLHSVLRTRADVVVHVRSVFLQGLLTGRPNARWPSLDDFDPQSLMSSLRTCAEQLGRTSLADLAVAFVRAQSWIDGVVIGVETRAQLVANLNLFGRSPLTASACDALYSALPAVPPALIDPTRWPKPPTLSW